MRVDISSKNFSEVFRNRWATELAPGMLLVMVFRLLCGLVFTALLLVSSAFSILALINALFGFDPFSIESVFGDFPAGIKGIVAILAALLFTSLFFGTMAYWSLRPVRRHLFARRYVRCGNPLESVEGVPTYEEASERGFVGLEVGDFYFSFDDCWLSADDEGLRRLRAAGGTLRVWYIPSGVRSWNPSAGKTVRYGGILVRAEWRP